MQVRLHRDGETLPLANFVGPDPRRGPPRLQSEAIRQELVHGLGVQLRFVDREIPELDHLAGEIERACRAPVQLNAFLSHGSKSALNLHADDPRLMIAQLKGSKHWSVRRNSIHNHRSSYGPANAQPGEVLFDERLAPGDVLTIPQGSFHDATSTGEASVALTLGVNPFCGLLGHEMMTGQLSSETPWLEPLTDIESASSFNAPDHELGNLMALKLVHYWCSIKPRSGLNGTTPPVGSTVELEPASPFIAVLDDLESTLALAAGGWALRTSATAAAEVTARLTETSVAKWPLTPGSVVHVLSRAGLVRRTAPNQ